MTYAAQQIMVGRKPGRLIEIDLPKCANSWGDVDTACTRTAGNDFTYSEQLDHADWTKGAYVSITANVANDSTGTATLDRMVIAASVGYQNVWQSPTFDDNEKIVLSCEAKAMDANWDWIMIYVRRKNNSYSTAVFDLTNGVIYSSNNCESYGIIDKGNGVYLCYIVVDVLSGATVIGCFVEALPTGGARPTAGDGSSGPAVGRLQVYSGTKLLPYTRTTSAAVTQTNTEPCYNTRKTCQDPSNFDGSSLLTVKLSEITAEHQFDALSIPCVNAIDTAHTQIEPARQKVEERNQRSAGLAMKCVDFRHHDRGYDPYVANRTYTPENQGTFFGKLKARNPYYQGAEVRIKTGFWADGYDAANFKTRTYYLEKFEGPDKKGNVKLVAQSPDRRLDDKRVTCPVITTGTLTATLAAATTSSFTVAGDEDLYATGGGRVAIGEEVIIYTSGLDNGDGTFTFSTLTRGAEGTTAEEYDAGETVQMCVRFDTQTARQIAYTLLTTYGGIAAGLIDTTQWDAIADTWLQQTYTRTIVEPTGIRQLLGETFLQMSYFVWWDEEAGKFYLEAIRPPAYADLNTYTQSANIIRDSVEVLEDPERRITQVHVYYDPSTPFAKDKKDFKTRRRIIDAGAESAEQFGDSRILEILANWIATDSGASAVGGRILNRFRENIRIIKFRMDGKDDALKTADHFYFEHDALQDEDGSTGTTLMQVVQRDEIKTGETYEYRAYVSSYYGRYGFIAPAGTSDYGSASDTDKLKYAWIPTSGESFGDGGTAYKII